MFMVDDTRKKRTERIRSLMAKDPAMAVIVAAADFEWTCRRCILALGNSPTKQIKDKGGVLYRCHGLDDYRDAWRQEVKPVYGKSLPEVIRGWSIIKSESFHLRHKLIHGISGTIDRKNGARAIESILAASTD